MEPNQFQEKMLSLRHLTLVNLWGDQPTSGGEIVKSPTNALNSSEFRVATFASTEIWPEILGDAVSMF